CHPGAWTGALALAFSLRFWEQATLTRIFTLHTVLLVAILHGIESCRPASPGPRESAGFPQALVATALLFGLSLANQYPLMMMAIPGLLILLASVRPEL